MMQEWNVRERSRAPFAVAVDGALVAEKNAQKALDAYREKEADARELGNYEAQVRVYEENVAGASERVRRLKQELARYDQQTAATEHQAPAIDDDQALQTFRLWLHGLQLATDEERAIVKRLLGQKK